VKFLLDEAIQHRLADHLAEAGHDATHVVRIGLAGAPDPEVLALAAVEGRILITTDTDFPTLLALSGDAMPSVILLRGVSNSIQGRLAAILTALPSIQGELESGAVAVVERERVRLRSLPIEPT
jgi:predicted nuclease of predicted toxin-antitoxin system